jgi:hypothetical protein
MAETPILDSYAHTDKFIRAGRTIISGRDPAIQDKTPLAHSQKLSAYREKPSAHFDESAALHRTAAQAPTGGPADHAHAANRPAARVSQFGNMLHRSAKLLWMLLRALLRAKWLTAIAVLKYCKRHPIHVLFNLLVVGFVALIISTSAQLNEYFILNQISDKTIDQVVTASRFTRSYDAKKVKKDGADVFLRVGAPQWSQRESIKAVLYHARKEGLSIEHQAALLATVEIESGFNPMARAPTTTACGLFQFVRATGKRYGLSMENCMDPWLNAKAGINHYLDNYNRRIHKSVKKLEGYEQAFRIFELSYYLHHDGPQSNNPSNDVKATVLGGTPFLLQAYNILNTENHSKEKAPTFSEQFRKNLVQVLTTVKEKIKQLIKTDKKSEEIVSGKDATNETTTKEP